MNRINTVLQKTLYDKMRMMKILAQCDGLYWLSTWQDLESPGRQVWACLWESFYVTLMEVCPTHLKCVAYLLWARVHKKEKVSQVRACCSLFDYRCSVTNFITDAVWSTWVQMQCDQLEYRCSAINSITDAVGPAWQRCGGTSSLTLWPSCLPCHARLYSW